MRQFKLVRSMRPQLVKIVAMLCLIVLVAGTALYNVVQPTSRADKTTVLVTIRPGMTTNDIGEVLYREGLIKNIISFRIFAKVNGLEKSLQAGDYVLSKDLDLAQIIAKLSSGQTEYQQITVPEGFTIDQIADLIGQRQLGSPVKFREAAKQAATYPLAVTNPAAKYPVEGMAFPDTYRISRAASEADILAMMLKQFDARFSQQMRIRAQEIGLSAQDVLTLASLVEKEARLPQDQPIIAGVFLKRLQIGMPLQSCATIQYILGYPKPELSIEDTQISSPYNTYLNLGLPPGPIANPGLAAIQAVLYPAETNYLYFVADKNGAHHFSASYEEHLALIEQVRK